MLTYIKQFVYPSSCLFCGGDATIEEVVCDQCLRLGLLENPLESLEEDSFFVDKLSLFDFELIQPVIHRLKYDSVFYETKNMLSVLHKDRDFREFVESFDIITWVPLHWYRALRRGYNQSQIIGKSLETHKGQSCGLLKRDSYTKSQTHFDRVKRKQNVSGVFSVRKNREDLIAGKRILLVDDVCTTGATARECGEVLLEKKAQAVSLLTLAQA